MAHLIFDAVASVSDTTFEDREPDSEGSVRAPGHPGHFEHRAVPCSLLNTHYVFPLDVDRPKLGLRCVEFRVEDSQGLVLLRHRAVLHSFCKVCMVFLHLHLHCLQGAERLLGF